MTTAPAKVPVSCPQCFKQLMVPVSAAGKQGRCPSCSHIFVLSALAEPAELVDDPLPDLAPLSSDPFGQNGPTSDYQLQSLGPQAYANAAAPAYGQQGGYGQPGYAPGGPSPQAVNPYMAAAQAQTAQAQNPEKYNHAFGLEQRAWDSGILGGLAMMAISLLIFFGALFLGYIVPYAFILFLIGVAAFIRGLYRTMMGSA
ncbi:MAG: hypothetical protein WD872_16985 [Pirellulaceae bacterium]